MELNNQRQLHLRDVLTVVFKRKRQILLVWLGCIALAATYSLLSKPVFEVSTRVMIKVGRENSYVSPLRPAGESAQFVDPHLEEQMNSEVEILKGRLLAQKVLDSLGATTLYPRSVGLFSILKGLLPSQEEAGGSPAEKAYNNALRNFKKNLKVEGIKKSNVIQISFRHSDPELAANLLNTLVKFYLAEHLQIHQSTLSFDFFREQYSRLKDDLGRAEVALNEFKEQHGIVSPEEQKRLLLGRESELRAELIRLESLEAEAQTRVDYYKNRPGPNPAYMNVLDTLLKSEAELKEIHAKKPILLGKLADYRRELHQLTEAENEFLNLQQRVEMVRQNLRLHQTKLQEEHYLAALDKEKVSNVSVIDQAWPPLDPVTPRGLFIILSVLLGGIAGIGIALFLEYFDDHIETAQDVERCLPGLPLLAAIPHNINF